MMEQSTCRHCGDLIDLVDGEWVSDADDVCGTDLRRDHQPVSNAGSLYSPGDQVRIKYDDDLGALAGRTVTILSGPDRGMYRVEAVVHGYVSGDHIRGADPTSRRELR